MVEGRKIIFEDVELNIDTAELHRAGCVVTVEPQVFDLIRFFAENSDRLLSREDIISGVWGGRIVSDAAISTRINAARRALGDDGKAQRVIKTVPRRGFRFLPEIQVGVSEGAASKFGSSQKLRTDLSARPNRPSIAILPFKCLTDDRMTQNLALGLRIDIQNSVTKVSGIFVTAVGSASHAAGLPAHEAAETLDVRYFLNGQVWRFGNAIRFSVQLVDVLADHVIWSDQYDRTIEDAFQYVDDITAHVFTALNVRLVAGEQARVWHKTLKELKSLEVFYRGISGFFQMSQDGMVSARLDFEKIARFYPHLSLGPTWISLTHWYDLQRGWANSRRMTLRLAREWAEKAALLEDCDGQAHTVLSHVLLIDREFDAALDAGAAAVRNRPNCAHANGFYANVLHHCGDQGRALKHIRLAIRHAPISPPLFNIILGSIHRVSGFLPDASAAVFQVLQSHPEDITALVTLATVAIRQDQQTAADNYVRQIVRVEPDFSTKIYVGRQPYRDADTAAGLADDMLSAGLPR